MKGRSVYLAHREDDCLPFHRSQSGRKWKPLVHPLNNKLMPNFSASSYTYAAQDPTHKARGCPEYTGPSTSTTMKKITSQSFSEALLPGDLRVCYPWMLLICICIHRLFTHTKVFNWHWTWGWFLCICKRTSIHLTLQKFRTLSSNCVFT